MSIIAGSAMLLENECKEHENNPFLRKIATASKKVAEQSAFCKECEAGIVLGSQSLKETYKSCEKLIPDINVNIKNGTGEVKIYSSSLFPKVWENLIDNSVRHGNASEANIYHYIKEDKLVIVYEDNGTGITSQDKENIFEEGFGKNTGMGMFLTKKILDITGIKISEVGEFGKGARFEMLVPKGDFEL